MIGVVGNIHSDSLETDTTDGMRYVPYTQSRDVMANFLVRTEGNPVLLTSAIKQAIASTDHTQTAYDIEPLETLVSNSLAGRRLIVWMLAAFAGLSLLLALVGIYGLISYITSQRTKEIGIRMALGAQQSNVVRLVLGKVIQWVLIGSCAGVLLSLGLTSLLQQFFIAFGSSVFPLLCIAAFIMLLVGIVAGLLPALRAAVINPLQALRND